MMILINSKINYNKKDKKDNIFIQYVIQQKAYINSLINYQQN